MNLWPALLLALLALVLLWLARRRQKAVGLPDGQVVYTDTGAWGAVEKPFYNPEVGLAGKPDYLVESGTALIPVEVKSSRVPETPYDSHIYQLAAYCLLVERATGKRPPHGYLHYTGHGGGKTPNPAGRTFVIEYTPALEEALLRLLDEMRAHPSRQEAPRSHDSPARCRHCGYKSICDQRLM